MAFIKKITNSNQKIFCQGKYVKINNFRWVDFAQNATYYIYRGSFWVSCNNLAESLEITKKINIYKPLYFCAICTNLFFLRKSAFF